MKPGSQKEKRRSIYKEFPVQPTPLIPPTSSVTQTQAAEFNPISSNNTNKSIQKIHVIARIFGEQTSHQSAIPERSVFPISSTTIQIIEPNEKKLLAQIDAFQKRERIMHSPPNSQNNAEQYSTSSAATISTPSKQDRLTNSPKPFHSPLRRVYYNETEGNHIRQNTFKFDTVFAENSTDSQVLSTVKSLYTPCFSNSRNMVLLNLNRSLISNESQFFKSFVQSLHSSSPNFFLHSYQLFLERTPDQEQTLNSEKVQLLEPTPIQSFQTDFEAEQIVKRMQSKIQYSKKQSATCFIHVFQLMDESKAIQSELVIIDMPNIMDNSNNSSSQNVSYNRFCADLINFLNFKVGKVRVSDHFHLLLMDKFRISDEILILSNLKSGLPHLSSNFYLLHCSQSLSANRSLFRSSFIELCALQNDHAYKTSSFVSGASLKEQNSALLRNSSMLKEQLKVLIADLTAKETDLYKAEESIRFGKEQNIKLKDELTRTQKALENANLEIKEQALRIDASKRHLGILDTFDRSVLLNGSRGDSQMKPKQMRNFLLEEPGLEQSRIGFQALVSTTNSSTQTEPEVIHAGNDNKLPDFMEEMQLFEVTPQQYLDQLDDMLGNIDSKRSISSYFSPRNLSLANLALLENEAFKSRLAIQDETIVRLNSQIDILSRSSNDTGRIIQNYERAISEIIRICEGKVIESETFIQKLVEFYESEISETRDLMKLTCVALYKETLGLTNDIQTANQEKLNWVQLFTRKTEEIYRHMNEKLEYKNSRIKQYEEVLQKFGQLNLQPQH